MLLIIFTKSSLVFCTMDFGMFSPQFCTLQIRFATQKNNREYALAHPRFVILLYVHLKFSNAPQHAPTARSNGRSRTNSKNPSRSKAHTRRTDSSRRANSTNSSRKNRRR